MVPGQLVLDLVEAMDDGGVVPAAERLSDLDELHAEEVPGQVHRHLPGDRQPLGPGLGAQPLGGDAPAARHDLLYPVDGRRGPAASHGVGVPGRLDLVRQGLAGQFDGDLTVLQ